MTAGGARLDEFASLGKNAAERNRVNLSRVVPDVNDDFSLARLDEKSASPMHDTCSFKLTAITSLPPRVDVF